MKAGLDILKAALRGWSEDRAASMGAAVAYYTVFSLAPILLLVIAVAGLVFGARAAQGALADELRNLMGQDGAAALEAMIKRADAGAAGPIATVIGASTLLVAATAVLAELQAALNVIWKVRRRPGIGLKALARHRLLCLALILASGILVTASLAASAAITAFGDYLGALHLALPLVLRALHLVLSFAVTTVLFAMILKILPDARIEWRDVWVGAGATALLFGAGKYLIGLYIGSRHIASVYGAAGAFAIVLVWVYYSTQILLFGAEVTKASADHRRARAAGRAGAALQPDTP